MNGKIIFIEDDPDLAFMLEDSLESEGFEVIHELNGNNLMELIRNTHPDILILDVNLTEGADGFTLGKQIRNKGINIPIIFSTGRTQIDDLKEGYSIGNVDYVKKPYSARELKLHINEMLRNRQQKENKESESGFRIGNYIFMPQEHLLKHNETIIVLTRKENTLLEILYENKNTVVTKEQLVNRIWGESDYKMKENSLNNLLSAIRRNLSLDSNVAIVTISKKGYKLEI
jgi:Response regulators consisting of a CheY-like receiver domain and a winged-helix DNA-binding domain